MPANGRYAYLAIAGVVLALCSLGASIVARWRRAGALLVAIATIVIALDWLVPLRRCLVAYDEATTLVSALRADLIGVSATHEQENVVLFVDDPPDFIKGGAGEPIAKVLQYGLAESVRPPFGPTARAPMPLPLAVSRGARLALDALPGTIRYHWDGSAGRLMPIAPEQAPFQWGLEIDSYDSSTGRLETRCDRCNLTRLVLLTAALPIVAAPIEEPIAGRARFDVSTDLLRGLGRLDDSEGFLWIEEPADNGQSSTSVAAGAGAISPIVRFPLGGDAAQNLADAAAKMRRDQNGVNAGREDDR